MKILKILLLLVIVGSVLSCTTKKSDEAAAGACSFASTGLGRATSYGPFDAATFDQCEQFNGTTSHWTGMDGGVSSTAMIALPSVLFNSGEACGSCWSVTGASATVIARVITECPSCAADVIDMDDASFMQVSGLSTGSGFANVTVTAIFTSLLSKKSKLIPVPVFRMLRAWDQQAHLLLRPVMPFRLPPRFGLPTNLIRLYRVRLILQSAARQF